MNRDSREALPDQNDTEERVQSRQLGDRGFLRPHQGASSSSSSSSGEGRGPTPSFFKADLNAYVPHWSMRRRQVKLRESTPEEFRSRSLAALSLSSFEARGSRIFQGPSRGERWHDTERADYWYGTV